MGSIPPDKSEFDSAAQASQPLEYGTPAAGAQPRFPGYWTMAVGGATCLAVLTAFVTHRVFEKVFASFKVQLPGSTMVLLRFSRWVFNDIGWLFVALLSTSLLVGGILLGRLRPQSFGLRRERWAARIVWFACFLAIVF